VGLLARGRYRDIDVAVLRISYLYLCSEFYPTPFALHVVFPVIEDLHKIETGLPALSTDKDQLMAPPLPTRMAKVRLVEPELGSGGGMSKQEKGRNIAIKFANALQIASASASSRHLLNHLQRMFYKH